MTIFAVCTSLAVAQQVSVSQSTAPSAAKPAPTSTFLLRNWLSTVTKASLPDCVLTRCARLRIDSSGVPRIPSAPADRARSYACCKMPAEDAEAPLSPLMRMNPPPREEEEEEEDEEDEEEEAGVAALAAAPPPAPASGSVVVAPMLALSSSRRVSSSGEKTPEMRAEASSCE